MGVAIDYKILTPVQFGTGDGSTTAFDLVGPDGQVPDSIVSANIYRDDWQGNQLLYPTARTNLIPYSEILDANGNKLTDWSGYYQTNFTGNQSDPSGGTEAVLLSSASGNTGPRFGAVVIGSSTLSGTSSVQCWMKSSSASGQTVSFGMDDGNQKQTAITNQWKPYTVTLAGPFITDENRWFQVTAAVGDPDFYICFPQTAPDSFAGSYIPTDGAAVTLTDYVLAGTQVTLGQIPLLSAVLTWTGEYLYTPTVSVPTFPETTVISQYGTSPTLRQLITNMDGYLDPTVDLDNFYSTMFDIDTAVGTGLDIWGQIVGVDRSLQMPAPIGSFFGFSEGNGMPFNSAPFYQTAQTQTYQLSDSAFRTLILVKAMSNMSNCTVPSYNQILQNLFAGRGRCYVSDLGNMQMQYTFEFALQAYELAILTQSGALPRPAGVGVQVLEVEVATTFGFQEAGVYQPFGYGVFGDSGITVIS